MPSTYTYTLSRIILHSLRNFVKEDRIKMLLLTENIPLATTNSCTQLFPL